MERQVIELNPMQAVLMSAAHKGIKRIDAECGRGTGKSTVLGAVIKMMAEGMPRGKVSLSGSSFRSMLGTTLPSTVEGLEKVGWVKNVHYYIGNTHEPRKLRWHEPYQSASDYTNYIRFFTGFAIVLVSQDKSSVEQRGMNLDGALSDERQALDPVRLYNEVVMAVRTNRREFEKCPLYRASINMGTTPMTREGAQWLQGEEFAREHAGQALWLRANAWQVNRHNLSPDWWQRARLEMPDQLHYDAEVMNIRPRLTLNGFYPSLKASVHYYRANDGDYYLGRHADGKGMEQSPVADMDYDPHRDMIVGIDPGSKINWLVVQQLVPEKMEQRTINSNWMKGAGTIIPLTEWFCEYYRAHRRKRVVLFVGRDANMRVPNSRKTVLDDIVDCLRKHGWTVEAKTQGVGITLHDEKYWKIDKVLQERDPVLYRQRINRDSGKNRDLIISLENAEAIDGTNDKVRKDKRSENRLGTVPAQHATHGSDAWDFPVFHYAKVRMNLVEGAFRDVLMR